MTYLGVVMAGRKKLERKQMQARVANSTPEKLHEIAASMGYLHGDGAAIGTFFDAIANRQLVVITEDVWKKLFSKSTKSD